MGYIGMCSPKGYGFSAVLVINRALILVSNRVWFWHSSLELGMSLEEATFSLLLIRPSTKALHKLCVGYQILGLPRCKNL